MVQTVQIYVLVQFLNKVVTRPLRPWRASTGAFLGRGYCHFASAVVQTVENCLAVLQLLFIEGRRHLRFYAAADPHGPGCAEHRRDSPAR